MSKVLGISAFYHDSAAAIIIDGKVVAAAQEERFTREKNTADFPVNAIEFCLQYSNCSIDDLDAVVFYDKPLLKFERLLETYYAFAPKGLLSFIKAMPVWLSEKLLLKKTIRKGLSQVQYYRKKELALLFSEHHLSHAASAFYPSPFEKAAILTIDGVGEWATASIGRGTGGNVELMKEMHYPHSVGLLYSSFTYFLGFKVNSGEYKVMGLAPYGDGDSEQTLQFIRLIKSQLIDINDDGSIWLNQNYFTYSVGLRMVKDSVWEALFNVSKRTPESAVDQVHCNLAFAVQNVVEDVVMKMAKYAKAITGCDSLCLAGGVALNCVANGKLERSGIFKNIFVQPAAGDAGGALGAALSVDHIYFETERRPVASMRAYLGPEFSDEEIETTLTTKGAKYSKAESLDHLTKEVARHLSNEKIVGWFQGQMEFGPRALGNRSILADPRPNNMQRKLNLSIKFRENFRPFAPSVIAEDAAEYFDLAAGESPFMLSVAPVKPSRQISKPDHYRRQSIVDRLEFGLSDIPAVTHEDYTARVQTVSKRDNERYWALLNRFKRDTGCSVLINTSFNIRGEPIVNTPWDAYQCFMVTGMDFLVLGNYILDKKEQLKMLGNGVTPPDFIAD